MANSTIYHVLQVILNMCNTIMFKSRIKSEPRCMKETLQSLHHNSSNNFFTPKPTQEKHSYFFLVNKQSPLAHNTSNKLAPHINQRRYIFGTYMGAAISRLSDSHFSALSAAPTIKVSNIENLS